jgi:hypothetical protein
MLAISGVVSLLFAGLAAVFGFEWIEELTGFEPDGGSGALEVMLIIAPAVAGVVCLSLWIRRRRQRLASA